MSGVAMSHPEMALGRDGCDDDFTRHQQLNAGPSISHPRSLNGIR